MSVTAASATATLTADEIIVETALGGVRYCLPSFSKTINLATTGAGGMDTGTAPVSGFVAVYAIWNPTTQTAALLATNATSAVAPNVYGGANMPGGYTASALVSVWGTNGSGQFTVGWQVDRKVFTTLITVLSASAALSNVAESIAGAVPKNAKTSVITQNQLMGGTGASSFGLTIAGSPIPGIGNQTCNLAATGIVQFETTLEIPLVTPQTIYVTWTVTGGSSPSLTLYSTAYTF
jgi:hypothetical protein